MLPIDEILESIKAIDAHADVSLVKRAYDFAKVAHEGQKRKSGEPFIIHPIEVAKIVIELRLDPATIASSLLHDVVEDCDVTLEAIRKEFGNEVAILVDGVTKLSRISEKQEKSEHAVRLAKEEEHFENLRRIFVAMAKDIRVIIIKLADRLHNLRTLCNLSLDRQKFIARETLEIFAPLAHRLGIWQLKGELEDLAFSYLEPEEYQKLLERVAKQRVERADDIKNVIETLNKRLQSAGIEAHIDGRPKHLYSVWQKMNKKGKSFESIHDLMAVRVMVKTVEDCYATLGIIHSIWMPLHDRIKDYIAKPKSNNYQSLHTTVYGPGNQPLEIQIRTEEMHRIAEYGVAAHWHYKEGNQKKNLDKLLVPWIAQFKDWQADSKSAKEYVQAFKMDFLETQVFVFTPKGDVIDLPFGSTPLDVAYRIHADVGHHCVGAKVDGRMVPIDYRVQNGDIVELVTSKTSPGPSWDWLKICKTSSAKHKIRLWFKKEKREENVLRGKEILEKFIQKLRTEGALEENKKEEFVQQLSKKSNFTKFVDFLEAIGYGDISLQTLYTKLREELGHIEKPLVPRRSAPRSGKSPQIVLVKGVDQTLVRLSRCCNPLPGDAIIGYVTLGKGVSVHKQNCSNLHSLQLHASERIIDVSWNAEHQEGSFSADIEVEAWDKPGLLGEVLNKLYSENVATRSCQASAKRNRATIRLSLEINNLERLQDIMKKIGELGEVIEVRRIENG